MQRVSLSGLFAAILISQTAMADDGPKFKKGVPTDAIRFVINDSDDAKASTMIFDNFQVATATSKPAQPDIQLKTFTYVRNIESTEDACLEQDFRGYVSRDGLAGASMIVRTGGKTWVVDLDKAIKNANDDPSESEEDEEDEFEGADDFLVTISTAIPKGQSLQTTVILLVDRIQGDDESGALLVLDTIDAEFREKSDNAE